jgi:Tol biopolymer transport system component
MTQSLRRSLLPLVLVLSSLGVVAQQGNASKEADFLTRIRRLTVEGRRAGEGYWSPDGQRLVFQSEREPGNPFYQIYLMDMATGDVSRVSPGMGKTTCSFINPQTGDVLFASTHHDPTAKQQQEEELKFRASGQERRYSWDYDPEMELYVRSIKTGALRRLTNKRGYDAEASYSPDGRWIVFSSTRQAYDRPLSAAEQKQLDTDPSYFGEIYIMPADADGSGVKRLTNVPGYDGGPFFSPDGKRIIWRRFDERGVIADVWTMNLDGTSSDSKTSRCFSSTSMGPRSRSGSRIPMASTGSQCRRQTGRDWHGRPVVVAAVKVRFISLNGIISTRSTHSRQRRLARNRPEDQDNDDALMAARAHARALHCDRPVGCHALGADTGTSDSSADTGICRDAGL